VNLVLWLSVCGVKVSNHQSPNNQIKGAMQKKQSVLYHNTIHTYFMYSTRHSANGRSIKKVCSSSSSSSSSTTPHSYHREPSRRLQRRRDHQTTVTNSGNGGRGEEEGNGEEKQTQQMRARYKKHLVDCYTKTAQYPLPLSNSSNNDNNESEPKEMDWKDIESVALSIGVGRKLRSKLVKYDQNYIALNHPTPITPPSTDPFGMYCLISHL
jgi:hypothetical protein